MLVWLNRSRITVFACRQREAQVNYKEGKRPYFRSDRTQFTVILPNLNHGVTTQDTTQVTTQVTTQDTAQVQRLLDVMGDEVISKQELMVRCGIKNSSYFGKEYLRPALNAGLIEMTLPDKPNSRKLAE